MSQKNTAVARPYAEASFNLAKETAQVEAWSNELALLAQIISSSSIQRVLTNPAIETAQQIQLILDIAGNALTKPVISLLNILADNERLLLAPEIQQLFEDFIQADSGEMGVDIVSAYVLKPAEEEQLKVALTQKFNCNVNIKSVKDSHLIGGIKIKAGDFVIDNSIKGQLTQLANQLGI